MGSRLEPLKNGHSVSKSRVDRVPLLKSIIPSNLLSFGPQTPALGLESLNVLIGPNGSGKSNLLDVIGLLRATPTDVRPVVARGGGVGEWIWKGAPTAPAGIQAIVNNSIDNQPLWHALAFLRVDQFFSLEDERIEKDRSKSGHDDPFLFHRVAKGSGGPAIRHANGKILKLKTFEANRSILAQFRNAEEYPDIAYLGDVYTRIRLYREWAFGRHTVFREPQRADLRTDRLEEDFSNLGLVLNRVRRKTKTKEAILNALRDLYEGLTDFDVSVEGGTVQVFFSEGDFTIPASRLSDGGLRYLCLLAILCDPEPPELIGIEEPEIGLHPDLLPKVADLLIDASQRTQLIVTTHSDILVDALTEQPSAVVVCEKHDGQTNMNRLDPAELAKWLKKYRLGNLWTSGQLGGNRW